MKQKILTINAELRNITKTTASFFRKNGYIPAVIYGKGHKNMNLVISIKEFMKQYNLHSIFSHVIELNILNKKKYSIVRDIQWHIIKDIPQHIDFQFIDRESEIKIDVPLFFINRDKSPGIKLGGALNILRRFITIKCSFDKIPHAIEIDLSGKMIGQSVHIEDIILPEGVKLISGKEEKNFTIVTISFNNNSKEKVQESKKEE